jgi:hypothetical protein
MIHAALTNPALFYFLVFMTLLLVMFLGAVIAAPPASPASPVRETPATQEVQAPVRPAPLPHRQPRAAAPAADAAGWSADADHAASHDAAPMPVHSSVRRPEVSGSPPWGPAAKPPGPPGQPGTSRLDGICGQTNSPCPRVPCGPPAARHRRARPRPPAPRPGIPGTAGDADQRQRNRPGSRSTAGRREILAAVGSIIVATVAWPAVAPRPNCSTCSLSWPGYRWGRRRGPGCPVRLAVAQPEGKRGPRHAPLPQKMARAARSSRRRGARMPYRRIRT